MTTQGEDFFFRIFTTRQTKNDFFLCQVWILKNAALNPSLLPCSAVLLGPDRGCINRRHLWLIIA